MEKEFLSFISRGQASFQLQKEKFGLNNFSLYLPYSFNMYLLSTYYESDGLPRWLSSKEFACNAGATGDAGLIPGPEYPLEKGMVTHSSILAWRIPWTEEPGGLQSIGSQRVGQD